MDRTSVARWVIAALAALAVVALLAYARNDPGVGGRALFAASLCDGLDHGRVVVVTAEPGEDLPEHPRLSVVTGRAEDPEVAARVAALAPGEPDALVLLGLGEIGRVMAAFERYAPLVGVGGHLVIENTVVNGWPVAPGYGMGPHEATVRILGTHPEFVVDPGPERYTITFNRSGFLRRTSA